MTLGGYEVGQLSLSLPFLIINLNKNMFIDRMEDYTPLLDFKKLSNSLFEYAKNTQLEPLTQELVQFIKIYS